MRGPVIQENIALTQIWRLRKDGEELVCVGGCRELVCLFDCLFTDKECGELELLPVCANSKVEEDCGWFHKIARSRID